MKNYREKNAKDIIESVLADKCVYVIHDNGWYYTRQINAFETEEQCYEFLGMTAKQVELEQMTKHYGEGHYYYTIEKHSLVDYINTYVEKEKEETHRHTIRTEVEAIAKKGNEEIYNNGYKSAKKELLHHLKAIVYFMNHNTPLDLGMYQYDTEELKQYWKDKLKED